MAVIFPLLLIAMLLTPQLKFLRQAPVHLPGLTFSRPNLLFEVLLRLERKLLLLPPILLNRAARLLATSLLIEGFL